MANYLEIIFINDFNVNAKETNVINIGISQKMFEDLLRKAKHTLNTKPFNRNYKVYVRDNLYLESEKDSEIKVYQKDGLALEKGQDYIGAFYFKNKLPMHNFPSTTKFHSIYYVDSTIFRIHNRVFLNFEAQYYPENTENQFIYKVFINYNHDENIEEKTIIDKINSGIKALGVQVPISETYLDMNKH